MCFIQMPLGEAAHEGRWGRLCPVGRSCGSGWGGCLRIGRSGGGCRHVQGRSAAVGPTSSIGYCLRRLQGNQDATAVLRIPTAAGPGPMVRIKDSEKLLCNLKVENMSLKSGTGCRSANGEHNLPKFCANQSVSVHLVCL